MNIIIRIFGHRYNIHKKTTCKKAARKNMFVAINTNRWGGDDDDDTRTCSISFENIYRSDTLF